MKNKMVAVFIAVLTLTVLLTTCLTEVDERVKVTFDVAGGSPEFEDVVLSRGKTLGDKFPASPPTKSGDEFLGWFSGFDEYFDDTKINADVTLTAKWKNTASSTTATVTFNSPDGIPTATTVTVTKGKALGPLFPIDPRRQGYWFDGWVTTDVTPEEFTKETEVNSDMTVTANWDQKTNQYTVTLRVPDAHQAKNPGIDGTTFQVWEGDGMNDWKVEGKYPFPLTLECADPPDNDRFYRFMRWSVGGTAGGLIYNERSIIENDVTLTGYYVFNFHPRTFEVDLSTALSRKNQKTTATVTDALLARDPAAELVGTPTKTQVVAKFNEQPQFLYFNVPLELIDLLKTASVAAGTQFIWEIDATLKNTKTGAVISNGNPDYTFNVMMFNLALGDNWNATEVRELSLDEINGIGEEITEADRIHAVATQFGTAEANRYWIGFRTRSNGWKGTDPGQGPATMTIRSFKIHLVQ